MRKVADKENIITLKVAMGTCGIAAGAKETFEKLIETIEEKGLDNIRVIQTGCMGIAMQNLQLKLTNLEKNRYYTGK
ncbi:hypothetical protein [Marinitoga lauensis]|uniref:hypothetical protein n=1 Tax=Marinitoga lauensis TaxID=2201189 RepID=UPI001F0EA43F|nr:hypothetical protein [Marinitoga lauensis]